MAHNNNSYSSLWDPRTMREAVVAASANPATSHPPTRTTNPHHPESSDPEAPPSEGTQWANGIPPVRLVEPSSKLCTIHREPTRMEIRKRNDYEVPAIADIATDYYRKLWGQAPRPTAFLEDLSSVSSMSVLEDFLGKQTVFLFVMRCQFQLSSPCSTIATPIFIPCLYSLGTSDAFKLTWGVLLALHMFAILRQRKRGGTLSATPVLCPNGSFIFMLDPKTTRNEALAFVNDPGNIDVSLLSCKVLCSVEVSDPLISTMASISAREENTESTDVVKPYGCCIHQGFRTLLSVMGSDPNCAAFLKKSIPASKSAGKRPLPPDEDPPPPSKKPKISNNFDPIPLQNDIDTEKYWGLSEDDRQDLLEYLERFPVSSNNPFQLKADESHPLTEVSTNRKS